MSSLANILDGLTVEGELYEKLEDNSVRCFACGHRCLIREGRRGICQVRFNQGGKLRVPHGYVAALQSDPIEKKPFAHVLPGSTALTFGMLGCDYHCGYCFTGDTMVITNKGPITFHDAFNLGENIKSEKGAEISYPKKIKTITSSGNFQTVKGVFKHRYQGSMTAIKPYYLPAIHCTPDHRIYATNNPDTPPQLIPAKDITLSHYLVIPRKYKFSSPQVIDVRRQIGSYQITFQTPWNLSHDEIQKIIDLSDEGKSSHEIGQLFGKSGSYIRHLRVNIRNGRVQRTRTSGPYVENGSLRFPNERHPGIPLKIKLDANVAEWLGYYCAEGNVTSDKNRPNSFNINFSFSKKETELANRVVKLLKICFNLNASLVNRQTTLGVSISKASLALLLKSLVGGRANEKRAPEALFDAPREIVKSFLSAYIKGDGHHYQNGKISSTTVSRELAYGIAWLALKCGYFASVYDAPMPETGIIQGRKIRRAPHQYTVVWYEDGKVNRNFIETKANYLIPIRTIWQEKFSGDVFNMEVDEEHDYLAGFLSVSNCQNWLTSQAMRDSNSDISAQYIKKTTPQRMMDYARSTNAAVVVSSYNEPLITSEWAVKIFKEAKANGLMCAYVSNGNNTPEVMEYISPYLDAYKIDLKCMSEKKYHTLGGTLKNTLDGIKRAHEMGLWVEVVTLVVPGFNDSNEELWDAARFLASLSVNIPWHVTAFHKDYKMTEPDNTDSNTLLRAAEIGREAGLRYVYAGNLPGNVGEYEDTHCPHCNNRLVKRSGYIIREYKITGDGRCPRCNEQIAGVWPKDPSAVALNGIGFPLPIW
jgi:pyruvate formate lyase activating enzyme